MNAGLDSVSPSGRMLYACEPELYPYGAVPVRLYSVRPPYAYAPFPYVRPYRFRTPYVFMFTYSAVPYGRTYIAFTRT